MRNIEKYFYIWLLCIIATTVSLRARAQNVQIMKVLVEDIQDRPLQFATAKIISDGIEIVSRKTNADGIAALEADFTPYDSVFVEVSYVNKSTEIIVIKRKDFHSLIKIVLQNLSLTLSDVVVTCTIRNQNSASSIIFDEEAIRQLQAFSLMDVMNALPGRKT